MCRLRPADTQVHLPGMGCSVSLAIYLFSAPVYHSIPEEPPKWRGRMSLPLAVVSKLPLGGVGIPPTSPHPGSCSLLACHLAPAAAPVQDWATCLPDVAPPGPAPCTHPPCPPLPLAPPSCLSADCSQPLDVVLLLDGSSTPPASYFDEMKSFAKAFISKANLGE